MLCGMVSQIDVEGVSARFVSPSPESCTTGIIKALPLKTSPSDKLLKLIILCTSTSAI